MHSVVGLRRATDELAHVDRGVPCGVGPGAVAVCLGLSRGGPSGIAVGHGSEKLFSLCARIGGGLTRPRIGLRLGDSGPRPSLGLSTWPACSAQRRADPPARHPRGRAARRGRARRRLLETWSRSWGRHHFQRSMRGKGPAPGSRPTGERQRTPRCGGLGERYRRSCPSAARRPWTSRIAPAVSAVSERTAAGLVGGPRTGRARRPFCPGDPLHGPAAYGRARPATRPKRAGHPPARGPRSRRGPRCSSLSAAGGRPLSSVQSCKRPRAVTKPRTLRTSSIGVRKHPREVIFHVKTE